jgi:hypothetical protein
MDVDDFLQASSQYWNIILEKTGYKFMTDSDGIIVVKGMCNRRH